MRLTPLDIRKQEFTRALRGFDAEEVLAFLQMLSGQWEDLLDEARRKDDKIRELESKMSHYEKVEEALQDALQTARETSKNALQNAEEKAKLIVDTAEKRAEDITRDAERDRHQIKRETARISGRRTEIVTRLRAFLMSELEILARYEGDDAIGFIKLLPADEQHARGPRPKSTRASGRGEGETPASRSTPSQSDDAAAGLEDDAAGVSASALSGTSAGYGDESDERVEEDTEHSHAAEADFSGSEHDAYDEPTGERGTDDAADRHGDGSQSEDVVRGAGWTNRPVVSQPSEPRVSQEATDAEEDAREDLDDQDEDDGESPGSSDEIQKIRRILKDLD